MNKSSFGQLMAALIFVAPALILGYVFFVASPTVGTPAVSTPGGDISTIAKWVLVALTALTLLSFTVVQAWKHREGGKKLAGGVIGLFKKSDEDNQSGTNDMKWFLFLILFVVTITMHYVLPDDFSRFLTVGLTVIAVFHIIVFWLFFVERRISLSMKIMMTGWFIFSVIAAAIPHRTYEAWAEVKTAVSDYDNHRGGSNEPLPQAARSNTTLNSTLSVVPGDIFRKVKIPPEKVIEEITWACPTGCVAEIQHEGDLLCNIEEGEDEGVYQGEDVRCRVAVVGKTSEGVKIYREQFLEPPGDMVISYPTNLVHVIYSFGTTEEFGPTDIKVKAIVSN